MANGLQGWFEKAFGKKNRDAAKLSPLVEKIKANRERYRSLSDDDLRALRTEFARRHTAGESLDDLLVEAYGVVWEGCRRLTERKATWIV